ncbi:MAG: hypothetical protein U0793_19845 [Gemmataceae bacterium]
MLTRTYQLSSAATPAHRVDPANRLLWRHARGGSTRRISGTRCWLPRAASISPGRRDRLRWTSR